MKNLSKIITAIILSFTVLFSLCSCSIEKAMKQDKTQGTVTEETAYTLPDKTIYPDSENNIETSHCINEPVTNSPKLPSQSDYKSKINSIISTLEIGKTYSELPLTPEKVGIKRFSCTNNIDYQSGPKITKKIYGDTSDPNNIIIRDETNYGIVFPIWYVGNKNVIKYAYFQYGNKYHYVSSDNPYLELENTDFSILYSFSGYNVMHDDHTTYTYSGKTSIDGYSEVLLFKSSSSELIYIDTKTAFCVKLTDQNTGVSPVNLTSVVINPGVQNPDFDKNTANFEKYHFNSYEDAVNAWINAYKNSDYGTIAELMPTLADNFKVENMTKVTSLPEYNNSIPVEVTSAETVYDTPDDEFFCEDMLEEIEEIKKVKLSFGTNVTVELYLFKETGKGWRVANMFF